MLAVPAYKVNPSSHTQFTFWETPPGSAKAIRGWFWPGDNFGQEFRYPSNLRQIDSVATAAPAPVAAAPAPEPLAAVEPAPQPALAAPAPAIIAQNTPPPTPVEQPAPTLDSATIPYNPPEALPQTASPYPIIGLGGLLALGLYFGVKAVEVN